MKKYYGLLFAISIFVFFLVGVLIYRAHNTDLIFK